MFSNAGITRVQSSEFLILHIGLRPIIRSWISSLLISGIHIKGNGRISSPLKVVVVTGAGCPVITSVCVCVVLPSNDAVSCASSPPKSQ